MKVGLVRRGYGATGGAESYLKRFAKALVDSGHTPFLFASREWAGNWPFGGTCILPGQTPRAFADAFAGCDRRHECDVVLSLERVWGCDCYRAGDGVHRVWLEKRARYEPAWKPWFRRLRKTHRDLLALEATMLREENTPLVIVNSEMVKKEIAQCFGYPLARIHTVYNGVPARGAPSEDRAAVRERLGLTDSEFTILFAGSGWERKGLRFAIRAMDALQGNAVLVVAGRGDPGAFPASRRTRFLGPVSDIRNYLAAADIFLLPTLYDPFSNACLEALAAGLPVITTSANGFAEVIEAGVEGEVLQDPSDSRAMAEAIWGWRDPERRNAVQPRLAGIARALTVEANMNATLALLEGCRASQEGRAV